MRSWSVKLKELRHRRRVSEKFEYPEWLLKRSGDESVWV